MSGLRAYTLMLEFSEGGTTTPLAWSKDALKPDSIIFVIDENSSVLWFWIGKTNSLVKRRTAMRQADSLKGHGYQVGKNLIGRGVNTIVEIDDRKVGREEEMTKNSKKFLELFNQSFHTVMEQVVVLGSSSGPATELVTAAPPRSKPASTLTPPSTPARVNGRPPVPKVVPSPVATPAPVPEAEPEPEPEPITAPEVTEPVDEPADSECSHPEPSMAKSRLEAPKIEIHAAPAEVQVTAIDKGLLKMGIALLAVTMQVPDVYVSKKADGTYEIESMDGVICRFKQKGNDVQFTPDSFSKLDPAKAKAVQEWYFSRAKSI
jgi:hypothetical protein